MNVIHSVKAAVQKRMAYTRLKNELAAMPLEVAIDLGMFREDAAKVATKTIYG